MEMQVIPTCRFIARYYLHSGNLHRGPCKARAGNFCHLGQDMDFLKRGRKEGLTFIVAVQDEYERGFYQTIKMRTSEVQQIPVESNLNLDEKQCSKCKPNPVLRS